MTCPVLLRHLGHIAFLTATSLFCQMVATGPPRLVHEYDDVQISTARRNAQAGQVTGFDLEVLRHAKDHSALSSLEKNYDSQTDELDKLKIASVLVCLGDIADPTYWNYLAYRAEKAVDSDAPNPTSVSPDGKPDSSMTSSIAFRDWSELQGLSLTLAMRRVTVLFPAAIAQLADSEDARAIPILRKGLRSRVYMIQVQSAIGLANLHDSASSNTIIALCKQDPPEVSAVLAGSALVYFDDAASQETVDQYLSPRDAQMIRQARKDGRTPSR